MSLFLGSINSSHQDGFNAIIGIYGISSTVCYMSTKDSCSLMAICKKKKKLAVHFYAK